MFVMISEIIQYIFNVNIGYRKINYDTKKNIYMDVYKFAHLRCTGK